MVLAGAPGDLVRTLNKRNRAIVKPFSENETTITLNPTKIFTIIRARNRAMRQNSAARATEYLIVTMLNNAFTGPGGFEVEFRTLDRVYKKTGK